MDSYIGVVDRRGQQKHAICSACELFYAIRSEFFFCGLVVLTTRSDAKI